MDNFEIYNQGRAVPPEAQKSFNNGKFSGTDINPMWRIKKLTEIFGPAGVGWYYDVISERYEEHGDMTMAVVDLNLYVKYRDEWSKPIYGTGGNTLVKTTKSGVSTSDEGYKMALTDALSVACKALGIGADIYFQKDTTKYTDPPSEEKKDEEPPKEMVFSCRRCKKKLTPYKDANGKDVGIRQHAEGSIKKFGAPYCLDCIRELYPDSVK